MTTAALPNYTVLELLSEGNHTCIYSALRESDGKNVIVKIHKTENPSGKQLAYLKHEYEALQKVKAPGVPAVYPLENFQNRLMLVMEGFDGKPLSTILETETLDLRQMLEISIEIASTVGDIHQHHIIHKDLKPQNILVDLKTNKVKIIDFAISTMFSREVHQFISPEMLEGTLQYISPEQTGRMNRVIDYRSDIYSLGIILYQLFTKRLPFDGATPMELIHQHLAKQPQSPSEINSDIPEPISEIILKCLAKGAEDRYHSAYGLKNDLVECKEQLMRSGSISGIVPGGHDVLDQFQLPQKLYGRDEEFQKLINTYSKVVDGPAILLTIKGESGVGKSALIMDIQKAIAEKNGYFSFGKFDQYKQNTPYYGLTQVLHHLMQQILSASDERLNDFKEHLLEATGSIGQTLLSILPEAELIIGKQPDQVQLSPKQAEYRMNYLLARFLELFIKKDAPLVIHLEDCQWIDDTSLKFLQFFMSDPARKSVLVILSYRNTVVGADHPLTLALKQIEQAGGHVENIDVGPLSQKAVQDFIRDFTHASSEQSQMLANIIYQKTQGNPFFINQFLKMIYEEGFYNFDKEQRCWVANIPAIEKIKVTDNVADIMSNKIRGMSPKVQELLMTGAAIGNSFDLITLAHVHHMSAQEAAAILKEALQEDLLIAVSADEMPLNTIDGVDYDTIVYKFQHDRIMQAAQQLIGNHESPLLHYNIGKVLLNHAVEEKRFDNIIDIVLQLNQGIEFIHDENEQLELANLNLQAGLKAKDSSGYISAIQFFSVALKLLPETHWKTHYNLSTQIYENLAVCEQLNGNKDKAEHLFQIAMENVRSNQEKAKLLTLKITLYAQMSDYKQALQSGAYALKLFGIDLNLQPGKLSMLVELIRARCKLLFKTIDDLENLPMLKDQEGLVIASVYTALMYSAYLSKNKYLLMTIAIRLLNTTIKYGICDQSAVAFSTYAGLLSSENLKEYQSGYEFGLAALKMAEKFPRSRGSVEATFIFHVFVARWGAHIRTAMVPLRSIYYQALEVANVTYAVSALLVISDILLMKGEILDLAIQEMDGFLIEVSKYKTTAETLIIQTYREVCLALKGKTADPTDPRPKGYNEKEVARDSKEQDLYATWKYNVWHVVLLCLYEKFDQAYEEGKKVLEMKDYFANISDWHIFYFYHCLTLAGLCNDPEKKKIHWNSLLKEYKNVKRWGKAGPMNFLHHSLLVGAEIARLSGKGHEALDLYQQSIQAALANEFIHEAALANELAGRFCLADGQLPLASYFMTKASEGYSHWGATAKVWHLYQKYPSLMISQGEGGSSYSGEKAAQIAITRTDAAKVPAKGLMPNGYGYDVDAIIEASQALSSEILLDKLMETLMHIVIINSGAEKGFLVLTDGERLNIHSEMFVNHQYTPLPQPININERKDQLSVGIVKYVARTERDVLLNDAMNEGNFTRDPYVVSHKPVSILCLPLIQQAKLVGVLYMENNLSKGAFTPARLRLLNMLSSQIAISIENARLYARQETAVADRTKEIQQKNIKLEQALRRIKEVQHQMIHQEKLASLGLLTSGIAHELKNPLNFIINFSQIATELTDEIKEKLSDGQKSEGNINEAKELLGNLREHMTRIDSHGKRADGIIKGMLAHAHQGKATPEATDINQLVEQGLVLTYQTYRKKAPEFNVSFVKDYDPSIGVMEAFPGDLTRVFINIIDNAFYAMNEKQKREPGFAAVLEIHTKNQEDSVLITIKDNGPGMPKEVLRNIFQPFYTTKPTGVGTGLGLSIGYDIVTKQHGGDISINTEPGKFTEFRIQIPKRKAPPIAIP